MELRRSGSVLSQSGYRFLPVSSLVDGRLESSLKSRGVADGDPAQNTSFHLWT